MSTRQSPTMNVSLTPQLEKLVNQKLATGRYQSGSEVVRDALRLLEERDRLQEERLAKLRIEIGRGLADFQAGRYKIYDEAGLKKLAGEIDRQGRERLARRSRRTNE